MISVPFQNNFNFGVGPNNVMQYNLDVQPVIPISLSEDWQPDHAHHRPHH